MTSLASMGIMPFKLPPLWGLTVADLLELEKSYRQLAERAVTKRRRDFFTWLADRYRTAAQNRAQRDKEP